MNKMIGLMGAGIGLISAVAIGTTPAIASSGNTAGGSQSAGCCKIPGPIGDLGGQMSDATKKAGGDISDAWKGAVQKGTDVLNDYFADCQRTSDGLGPDGQQIDEEHCKDKTIPIGSTSTSSVHVWTPPGSGGATGTEPVAPADCNGLWLTPPPGC